jgi:hypothetical protein
MKTSLFKLTLCCLLCIPAIIYSQVNVLEVDGRFYTPLIESGTIYQKYDLVIMGDGYTVDQQDLFNQNAQQAVDALRNFEPYASRMCAFNIWRINVVSNESGSDHPRNGTLVDTALDTSYGDPSIGQAERCIWSNDVSKIYEAAAFAPGFDAILILVNFPQSGGCAGGGLMFSANTPGFQRTVTHELGHNLGFLADEYTCYVCNGTDSNRSYPGGEPSQVNLTINQDRATTKWANLINSSTPIPTTVNNPNGVVGLWEGGGYHQLDIFRPQLNCQMRNSTMPFCAVCHNQMNNRLESHCSLCELNPLSPICTFIDRDLRRFRWWDVYVVRVRIPFGPICLSCPPWLDTFNATVRFPEVIYQGFEVVILNQLGKEVSRTKTDGKNAMVVEFVANRFDTYTAQITTSAPASEFLDLRMDIETQKLTKSIK